MRFEYFITKRLSSHSAMDTAWGLSIGSEPNEHADRHIATRHGDPGRARLNERDDRCN